MRDLSKRHLLGLCGGILVAQSIGNCVAASKVSPDLSFQTGLRRAVIERSRFIQIPEPNPILIPAAPGCVAGDGPGDTSAWQDRSDRERTHAHASGTGV